MAQRDQAVWAPLIDRISRAIDKLDTMTPPRQQLPGSIRMLNESNKELSYVAQQHQQHQSGFLQQCLKMFPVSPTYSSAQSTSGSSSSRPSWSPTTAATANYLELMLLVDINSINTRNLTSLSAHKAPYFLIQLSGTLKSSSINMQTFTIPQWLAWLSQTSNTYPAYQITATEINTVVGEFEGVAEVYVSVDVTGVLPGKILRSVASVSWRLEGERWICIGVVVVPGLEPVVAE